MTKWFYPGWYQYLFDFSTYKGRKQFRDKLRIFWCRLRGHPNGPVWYACGPEAMEPNMHCIDCGEEL